ARTAARDRACARAAPRGAPRSCRCRRGSPGPSARSRSRSCAASAARAPPAARPPTRRAMPPSGRGRSGTGSRTTPRSGRAPCPRRGARTARGRGRARARSRASAPPPSRPSPPRRRRRAAPGRARGRSSAGGGRRSAARAGRAPRGVSRRSRARPTAPAGSRRRPPRSHGRARRGGSARRRARAARRPAPRAGRRLPSRRGRRRRRIPIEPFALQFRVGYRAGRSVHAPATLGRVRRTLLLVALGGALLAASGPAGASTTGARACGQNGLRCLDVPVPLDRTGATPGTITLHVEELPPAGTSRGFIFLIAGGPGQGSAHSFSLSSSGEATLFRFVFPDYTLVAYDDRGTGSSGLISCPGLQAAPPTDQQTQLAADCAQTIGPTSQFYSTADHAEDLDAVRQAIGADTIALFGVSYGTKLARAYALAHPDTVNRLLLDSVVPADLPDPYAADVLHEMPNTLSAYCPGTTCRAATPSFSADVVALANRIEDKPMSAKVLQPNGTLKTVTINGETLLSTIIEADLDPGLA